MRMGLRRLRADSISNRFEGLSRRGHSVTSIEKNALDRWMYQKNGMDYGPFSTKDILDMIQDRQVDDETEIRSCKSSQWKRLIDFQVFGDFFLDLRQKESAEKRRQQLEESVMRVQRTVSGQSRRPYALGAILVLAVGIGLYFTLRPAEPAGARLSFDIFKELSFERLSLVRKTIAAPADTPKKTTRKKKVARTSRSGTATRNGSKAVAGAFVTAPQVDLSFDSEDLSGGRELTRDDLDSIQIRATPRLIRCFRDAASMDSAFRGGVVTLYIQTSGRVALSRLETTPHPTPSLRSCAQASVNRLRVPPFAGANQVMEIPMHVAAVK